MAFLTSTKASTRVFSVRPSHQALPKTLETGFKRRMVSLGFPVFFAFPTALLLNDPLIWVSGNAVLLGDRDNHLATSKKLSRPLIYTFELLVDAKLKHFANASIKKYLC